MIAVDTQILVYAFRAESDFHQKSLRVLKDLAESGDTWAIPWSCFHEFINIATHPKIYSPPATIDDALRAIDEWKKSETLIFLAENEEYYQVISKIAKEVNTRGPLIHDVRIASVCIANNIKRLWTIDRDFSRFPMLKTENPLI